MNKQQILDALEDISHHISELDAPVMRSPDDHVPMQPIVMVNGVARFKENVLVRYLLDHGGIDLNRLALVKCSREDRAQLAQLIGYSVSGYGDLSYSLNVAEADKTVERLLAKS